MTSLQFLSYLIESYGLYAVFFLAMIEGDITLLLAGVLAHNGFFDDGLIKNHGFLKLLFWGTLAGFASDNLAYAAGRAFGKTVRGFRIYRSAAPRIERQTERFGGLAIFLSKYVYGMRWASCAFYGVGRMPYLRFMPLSLASCFVWVTVLSGIGFFFSSAVMGLIRDFRHVGKILLVIVIVGAAVLYLLKRTTLPKKVEDALPDRLKEIKHTAIDGLKELKDEVKEELHLKKRSDA